MSPTVTLSKTYRQAADGLEHLCSRCQQWLPATPDVFTTERRSKYGLGALCLSCNRKAASRWRTSRPDLAAATSERRHARDRRAPGKFTSTDRAALLDQYRRKCVSCGMHESVCGQLICDHVVPVALGGSHDSSNRQPLCRHCNLKKATSSIDFRPAWTAAAKPVVITEEAA